MDQFGTLFLLLDITGDLTQKGQSSRGSRSKSHPKCRILTTKAETALPLYKIASKLHHEHEVNVKLPSPTSTHQVLPDVFRDPNTDKNLTASGFCI